MKGCLFMKKMFKKSLATVMAVASLATGMVGMSASAVSETVNLYKDAGAPGSSTRTSCEWSYTTSLKTSTISVDNFSATDNSTKIFAYISVDGDTKADGYIYPSGGSVTASDLKLGKSAYATAYFVNLVGNMRANVSISG